MHKVTIFISIDGTTTNGYTFNDNVIKSMRFSDQLMDTSFNINPTVIEQYAEIVFKDKQKQIFNLVKSGKLYSDMKVFVYIDEIIRYTYLTSSWRIQLQTSTITLNCNDPSKKLENIQTQLVNVLDRSIDTLFQIGFSLSGYSYAYQDDQTAEICRGLVVADSYISYQDLLTYFKKLCIAGFVRVYWKRDKFIIARCYV